MASYKRSITETILFRLAQALLPEAALLALFGKPAPVAAQSRRRFRR